MTFPSNLVYSSRTSCSRSETFGFEVPRRGFSVFVVVVGVGVAVAEEGSVGSGVLKVDIIDCYCFLSVIDWVRGFGIGIRRERCRFVAGQDSDDGLLLMSEFMRRFSFSTPYLGSLGRSPARFTSRRVVYKLRPPRRLHLLQIQPCSSHPSISSRHPPS